MIKYYFHKFIARIHVVFIDYHSKRLNKWYQYVHEVDMKNAIIRYCKNDVEATKELFNSYHINTDK